MKQHSRKRILLLLKMLLLLLLLPPQGSTLASPEKDVTAAQ
jgi:hypothetical protein